MKREDYHELGFAENLAKTHYENFSVAAWFLPKKLRKDLFHIYVFCRLSDDFADESADSFLGQSKIDDWECKLMASLKGDEADPFFNRLCNIIQNHNLTVQYFKDLLDAFRIDLTKKRYANFAELREYTRLSADPVGRIVLELFRSSNDENNQLSDKICTALQLVNHWQDVKEDYLRGRIYLPLDEMTRFKVVEKQVATSVFDNNFHELLAFQIERAEQLFLEGLPLVKRLRYPASLQIALYISGGMGVVKKLRKVNFNVFGNNAKLTNGEKLLVGIDAVKQICKPQ